MRKILLILPAFLLLFIASKGPSSADPINFDDANDANLPAPFDDSGWTTSFPGISKHYLMSFEDTYESPAGEIALKNRDALKNEEKPHRGDSGAKGATSVSTVSPDLSAAEAKMEPSHGKSKAVDMQPRKTAISAGKDPGHSRGGTQSLKWVYVIQVGAFGKRENAERFRKQLQHKYPNVITGIWESNGLYRVHLGGFPSEAEARRYKEVLKNDNLPGVVVHKE